MNELKKEIVENSFNQSTGTASITQNATILNHNPKRERRTRFYIAIASFSVPRSLDFALNKNRKREM